MPRRTATVLRLYVLDDRRTSDFDRACAIIEGLRRRRKVDGAPPQWRVVFEIEDQSLAMETCACELAAHDPQWLQYIDFSVLRGQ